MCSTSRKTHFDRMTEDDKDCLVRVWESDYSEDEIEAMWRLKNGWGGHSSLRRYYYRIKIERQYE